MRLAVLAATSVLSGCGGTLVMHKDLDEVRQAVVAEMQMVLPHIKPDHLKECQKLLEQPSILGAQYKIPDKAQLIPSIGHSCLHQGRSDSSLIAVETDQKTAVLVVRMIKVAGMYGTGGPEKDGACRFRITKGDTKVSVWHADTKAPINSTCHRI